MKMPSLRVARAVLPFVFLVIGLVASEAQAAPGTFDLSSPANGAWCTATCAFAWQASSTAMSYQLYVDGALKKDGIAVASPLGYTLASGEAMADGWHTWYVVAKDSTGATQQSTSTWSARVDSTPPAAFAVSSPTTGSMVISSPATFSWAASSDGGSGLDHYEIWINGAAAATAIPSTATSGTAPLPTTRFFWDPISSGCANWNVTTILGSLSWTCATPSGVPVLAWGQGCCDSMRQGYETLAAPIDLTNAGQAQLRFDYESYMGSTASYGVAFSDDGGTSWWNAQGDVGERVFNIPTGDQSASWATASGDLVMAGTANAILRFDAFDKNWTNWLSVHNVEVTGIAGATYDWNVVAVDVAGNRTASETRQVRYDLPPLPFDLTDPPDSGWVGTGTPTLTWKASSDPDAGLAKYQVWIDGNLTVDNIPATAISTTLTTALADGSHRWQVYAVDSAGSVRRSRQRPWLNVDTNPPTAFSLASPADRAVSAVPTPSLCWYCTGDLSGVDHYELMIDGALSRGGVADPGSSGNCGTSSSAQVCANPGSALSEGGHKWNVKAVDKVGNSSASNETWTVYVDFSPPAAFSLISPGTGTGVVPTLSTAMPTFSWQASSSAGSGLDHYELYVVNEQDLQVGAPLPTQLQGLNCTICSIPPATTSVTVAEPLRNGSYFWSVRAVDKLGGSTIATTGNNGYFFFDLQCLNGCQPGGESSPEMGPEAAPEPSRDAGIDAPFGVGTDGSTGTSTSTSTASATATSTATSVGAEPRPDAGTTNGIDAPAVNTDAATIPDAAIPRDIAQADGAPSRLDASPTPASVDGSAGVGILDGAIALADGAITNASDAKTIKLDGGQLGALDAGAGNSESSGCGCAVGGHHSRDSWGWALVLIGLAAPRRGLRPRRTRQVGR